MKKLILFLLLVPFAAFGQLMTKPAALKGTALQYTDKNPRSVVILLHGTGEKGMDLSKLLAIKFIGDIDAGRFTPTGRIVIIPQLPANQPGWYGNTMDPIMAYARTFKLPIDITGYSLGGIGVGDNVPQYVNEFHSAATVYDRVDYSNPKMIPAFTAIPSIHYYDPTDNTVAYGYTSILSLFNQLTVLGKKDIAFVTLVGTPTPHNIWNQAYDATHYWAWLNTLDGGTTAPPVPTQTHIFINDKDLGVWIDPVLKVEIK